MITNTTKNTRGSGKVFILVAPGFEEGDTVYCLARLRDASVPVTLVGISAGLINGAHGIAIRPDCTLGQITSKADPKIIFIPDGKKSVSSLLADPRVHRLIASTVENGGTIAAMPVAASMLHKVTGYSDTAKPPIIQANGSLDNFANQIINLVTA